MKHTTAKKLHGSQIVQDGFKCQFFGNNKVDFSGPKNCSRVINNLNGFRTLWEPCKFFYTRVFHLEVESNLNYLLQLVLVSFNNIYIMLFPELIHL